MPAAKTPVTKTAKPKGTKPKKVKANRAAWPRYSRERSRRSSSASRPSIPKPKGELEHVNAFTLLVAVVLSAQATDVGVNKATRALFEFADTPDTMLALGEERVGQFIRTIGLWRNKARMSLPCRKR